MSAGLFPVCIQFPVPVSKTEQGRTAELLSSSAVCRLLVHQCRVVPTYWRLLGAAATAHWAFEAGQYCKTVFRFLRFVVLFGIGAKWAKLLAGSINTRSTRIRVKCFVLLQVIVLTSTLCI